MFKKDNINIEHNVDGTVTMTETNKYTGEIDKCKTHISEKEARFIACVFGNNRL